MAGQNEHLWMVLDMLVEDGVSCGSPRSRQWRVREDRLDSSHPLYSSSTMRLVLLALRLMCMAWFWPVTQLNSSHFPNKRRHKEQYVGETTKPKHGGWDDIYLLCVTLESLHFVYTKLDPEVPFQCCLRVSNRCEHISRTLIPSRPRSLVVIKRVEIQLTIADCVTRCHLCVHLC